MKFPRSQTVSYEPFDDGEYLGVIVGFSYVGMHKTKEWGSKPKCMVRWEIHDLDAPHALCVDEKGSPYAVSQNFPATIQGEASWLYKCLLAHGLIVPTGGCAESKDWYGKVAKLTVEGAQGNRGDKVFMNVTDIQPLGFDVNIRPSLAYEHWEPEDQTPPPAWATSMIRLSSDLYRLVQPGQGRGQTNPVGRTGQGPTGRPTNPSRDYRPPQGQQYEDDDIPFNDMIVSRHERMNQDREHEQALFQVWRGEVIK